MGKAQNIREYSTEVFLRRFIRIFWALSYDGGGVSLVGRRGVVVQPRGGRPGRHRGVVG